jgi:hypothetical protein
MKGLSKTIKNIRTVVLRARIQIWDLSNMIKWMITDHKTNRISLEELKNDSHKSESNIQYARKTAPRHGDINSNAYMRGAVCLVAGFHVFGYLMLYLSACVNPIIYVIMNKQYRQAYKTVLLWRRPRLLSLTPAGSSCGGKYPCTSELCCHNSKKGGQLTH